MLGFVFGVLTMLVLAAIASVAKGLMPSHADAVFLGMAALTAFSYLLWQKVLPAFDNTNGNETGLIANLFYLVALAACLLAAPIATLAGVPPWTAFGVGAGVSIVSGYLTLRMHG